MITEDYVSFETAKLLKEKGFDEPCECFYDTENNDVSIVNGWMNVSNSELEKREFVCYSAPTLQMAMKWLRDEYNIDIIVFPYKRKGKTYYARVLIDFYIEHEQKCNIYSSYEGAAEAAIKYCLEKLI